MLAHFFLMFAHPFSDVRTLFFSCYPRFQVLPLNLDSSSRSEKNDVGNRMKRASNGLLNSNSIFIDNYIETRYGDFANIQHDEN